MPFASMKSLVIAVAVTIAAQALAAFALSQSTARRVCARNHSGKPPRWLAASTGVRYGSHLDGIADANIQANANMLFPLGRLRSKH